MKFRGTIPDTGKYCPTGKRFKASDAFLSVRILLLILKNGKKFLAKIE